MFRNKEFRKFAALFSSTAIIIISIGFIISRTAGILTIFSAVIYGIIFYIFTKARYKSIAQLSEQIDLVLHDIDRLYISESDEGELAVLQSEITKMTLHIKDQNDSLRKEKEHLAESLADIAHQLRTPLTSINLILSLLANDPDENERKPLMREMEELLMRMDFLITSLLKLSRLDAGIVNFQSEQIDVNELMNTALRPLLIPMELRNIHLQIDIPKAVEIQGDSGWLSEAIQNILKNCMESAGNNGQIKIVCEDTLLFTEITIHDNGPGFRTEDLFHLFDRFYRGKNGSTAGYGIGLALCRTIIIRQGGTITAKNHPQGGAIFSIRFPK